MYQKVQCIRLIIVLKSESFRKSCGANELDLRLYVDHKVELESVQGFNGTLGLATRYITQRLFVPV